MKTLLSILAIFLFSCHEKNRSSEDLTKTLWITERVKLTYVEEDETSYGIATILKFEPNLEFKTLTNEFEYEEDTIFWGRDILENYSSGTWKKDGKYFVATHTYFVPSEDKFSGKKVIDSFYLDKDKLIRNNNLNFKRLRFIDRGLTYIFDSKWSDDNKNGK